MARPAGRVWHRTFELLDRGGHVDHDLDGHRSEGLSDDHEQGDSRYEVSPQRLLFAEKGTELKISPLLEGIRTLSGEKIQWYLASELRDRIRDSKARVTVIDKLARKQYEVEPRQFEGRLLHQLPRSELPTGMPMRNFISPSRLRRLGWP